MYAYTIVETGKKTGELHRLKSHFCLFYSNFEYQSQK